MRPMSPQCVVARRPSISPVAASISAPAQTLITVLRRPACWRSQLRTASFPRTFGMFGTTIRSGSRPSCASSSAKLKSGTTSRPPDRATGSLRSATVATLNAPAVLNATYGPSASATSVTSFPSTTTTVGFSGSSASGAGKTVPGGCTGAFARYVATADRTPTYPTPSGSAAKATTYTTAFNTPRVIRWKRTDSSFMASPVGLRRAQLRAVGAGDAARAGALHLLPGEPFRARCDRRPRGEGRCIISSPAERPPEEGSRDRHVEAADEDAQLRGIHPASDAGAEIASGDGGDSHGRGGNPEDLSRHAKQPTATLFVAVTSAIRAALIARTSVTPKTLQTAIMSRPTAPPK